jgi:GNAT superfamily N-acetyltransferase
MHAEIRFASEDDIDLMLPLVRAYHEHEGLDISDSERESSVRGLISDHAFGGIWLIYVGGAPVGYIVLCKGYSIEFGGYDAFIDEFYIRPEFRGKGFGKSSLELIKAEATKIGIRALHLEVARTNEIARKLYAGAGFEAREKYVLMSIIL